MIDYKLIPNIITAFRIVLIVFIAISLEFRTAFGDVLASLLVILTGATDWLDGYLARKWEAQSSIGKVFDPVADKLSIIITYVVMAHVDMINNYIIVCIILIIFREIIVSGLREFINSRGLWVEVNYLSKIKTVAQMCSIIGIVLADKIVTERYFEDWFISVYFSIHYSLLCYTLVITLYTGYSYFKGTIVHLKD